MIINHNLMAMNTHRQLGMNNIAGQKSIEKLSSGFRINRAGDDAAGLAISEKMRGQIRGLNQASRNAQDGISFIQTAEGALTETHAILQRMRELAVQSANDTNIKVDRGEIQKEMDQLASEITRIANNTEFNQQILLNGGITSAGLGEVKFHIGANEGQDISLSINAMDAKSLGISRDTFAGTPAGSGIQSAVFEATTGSKITTGATLTFQYNEVTVATGATITASGAQGVAATTASGAGDLVITIDGKTETITVASGNTIANVASGINAAFGVDVATASGDTLTITSTTTGSNSNVTISSGSTAATLTWAKLSAGSITGQDVSKTITISNSTSADDQVVNIADETATTFTVNNGNYAGLTITMADTKTLADLNSANDTVTVSTLAATAAIKQADGTMSKAVTNAGIDISTQTTASKSITTIQTAIETVSAERSKLGAMQNRLEHTIKNLDTSAENLQASESRIRDVDMAKEMMEFTKQNILQQAATAMLAQANMAPQAVLQLLR